MSKIQKITKTHKTQIIRTMTKVKSKTQMNRTKMTRTSPQKRTKERNGGERGKRKSETSKAWTPSTTRARTSA